MKVHDWLRVAAAALIAVCACVRAHGADMAGAVADRAAVERVYAAHRLEGEPGTAPALSIPADVIEKLVREDSKKEVVLARVYGVTITTPMLDAEVRRINATTRAPGVLAEIKAALGGDPARFARTVAEPLVVERTLRARFENDDALHAPQRGIAEAARAAALTAKPAGVEAEVAVLRLAKSGVFAEAAWQLGNASVGEVRPVSRSANYAFEASVQLAVPAATPVAEPQTPAAFTDLDPELQKLLAVQLQKAGDVSAVVESPTCFVLFLLRERIPTTMSVYSLTVPKRNFEEWLAEQPDGSP